MNPDTGRDLCAQPYRQYKIKPMQDTPEYIWELQHKVCASRPLHERATASLCMILAAVTQRKHLIRQEHPDCPEHEVTIAFVRHAYGKERGEATVARFAESVHAKYGN